MIRLARISFVQALNLAIILIAALLMSSTSLADCFSGSGKSGVVRNLNKPWVMTVFLGNRPGEQNSYRLKSFGVNLQGTFDCKGHKSLCQTDNGQVTVTKTKSGIEMHFSQELAVQKRDFDDDEPSRSVANEAPQIFKLNLAHSDICYDAFFRKAGANYDEFNREEAGSTPLPTTDGE